MQDLVIIRIISLRFSALHIFISKRSRIERLKVYMNLKSKSAKFAAGFVGFAIALSLVVTPVTSVKAQSVSDLQAQIASLLAQIAQLQSMIGGGGSATTGSAPVAPLTLGSSGAEVTKLQNWLISKGYAIPAGATGYFGGQTQAALAAFQAANGISPAAGYYGPVTAAKVASMTGSVPTPGTPGTPTTGTPSGITTPGVEGILTAELAPTPGSGTTIRGGQQKAPLIGLRLKAVRSDIAVQSIRVNLGTSLSIATKILANLVLLDSSGNTLARIDNLQGSISEEGTTRFVVFSGFNMVIPKDSQRDVIVAGDLFTNVSGNTGSKTFTIPVNGVRGVDGVALDQRSPTTAFSNSVTVDTALTDSATLTVSLSPDSPLARQTIATEGSSRDEINRLELSRVRLKATGDNVRVRTWPVTITKSGSGGATASTAYLMDGSTEISSATISSGVATFSNLDFWVNKDQTRTFTIMTKVTGANNTSAGFAASTTGAVITAENTEGTTVTPTGTASSSEIAYVLDKGLEISLVSKSVSTDGVPQGTPASGVTSTSTLSAVFSVKLKAVDSAVFVGTVASGTPAFASSTTGFKVYKNGAYDGTISASATTTSFSRPSGYSESNNTFTLNDGDETTIPVTFAITGRKVDGTAVASQGSQVAIGLEGVQWILSTGGTAQTSNFMAGQTSWRTSDVTFP